VHHLHTIHTLNRIECFADPGARKVIVLLRDPVSRLVSAFNWRHINGSGKGVYRYGRQLAFERKLYGCFPTVDAFARALARPRQSGANRSCLAHAAMAINPSSGLTHTSMGYTYYFGRFGVLDAMVAAHTPVFAVRSTSFEDDARNIFVWLNGTRHAPQPPISATQVANLAMPSMKSTYRRRADAIQSESTAAALAKVLRTEYSIVAQLLCLCQNTRNSVPITFGRLRLDGCPSAAHRTARWRWFQTAA